MKNKVDFTPYEKVNTTKFVVIILAIILTIAGIYFLFEEEAETGFTFIGCSISLLLLGGIIAGIAEMVKAACIHNWEFDQKMREIEMAKIEDEEIDIDPYDELKRQNIL